jgi:hypothetical protein
MTNLNNSKPSNTSIEVNLKLHKNDDDPIDDQSLVGNLVYLTITRPDISFSVNIVSQFMNNPRHLHLDVVHCIIHYLKSTLERGIVGGGGGSKPFEPKIGFKAFESC